MDDRTVGDPPEGGLTGRYRLDGDDGEPLTVDRLPVQPSLRG